MGLLDKCEQPESMTEMIVVHLIKRNPVPAIAFCYS